MVGKGIKIIYESQTKRINEKVENYDILKEKIKCVFNLKNWNFNLLTETKIAINNDQDMRELFKMSQNIVPKIFVYKNDESHNLLNFCENKIICCDSSFKSDIFDNFSFIEFIRDNEKLNQPSKNEIESKKELLNIVKVFVNDIFERATERIIVIENNKLNIYNYQEIKRELCSNSLKNKGLNQSTGNQNSPITNENILEKIQNIVSSKLCQLEQKFNHKILEVVENHKLTFNPEMIKKNPQILTDINSSKIEKPKIVEENFIPDQSYDLRKNQQRMSLVKFNEKCIICSEEIFAIKYSCIICPNMTSCQSCQSQHLHPMLSLKSNEQFSYEDLSYMMSLKTVEKRDENNRSFFRKFSDNFFEKKNKPKLYVYSNFFTVRPNKKFKIPIILSSENIYIYPNNSLIVLTRGNLDLQISQLLISSEITTRSEFYIECQSGSRIRSYDFEIILYCKKDKAELEVQKMKIEVNEDLEEEMINDYFAMYSKILAIPKKEKEMIMYINKKQICVRHPYIIYNIMTQHNWNLEEALDDLTYDDEINSQPIKI
jgi:hypothetical protein